MPRAAFECGVLRAGRRRVLDQLPLPAGNLVGVNAVASHLRHRRALT
jgi:hypothetical protein